MNDQPSVYEQLADLYLIANERGLYDAADWIRARAKEMEEPSVPGEFPRLKGESWDDYAYRFNRHLSERNLFVASKEC